MEDVGKELKRIISKRNYQEKYAEMIADVLNDTDVQAFLSAHQEELTQADIEKATPNCMSSCKKSVNIKKRSNDDRSRIRAEVDVEFSLCGCHLCTNRSIVSSAKTRRN